MYKLLLIFLITIGCYQKSEIILEYSKDSGSDLSGQLIWKTDTRGIHFFAKTDGKEIFGLPLNEPFLTASKALLKTDYKMATFKFSEQILAKCYKQTLKMIKTGEGSLTLEGDLTGRFCQSPWSVIIKRISDHEVSVSASVGNQDLNRLNLTYLSDKNEHFFGFGEQFSHLDLKGKKVFLFTEEQGIGRGDQPITWGADLTAGAGGNEFSTYIPIPFYVTNYNRSGFFHHSSYSTFDLRDKGLVRLALRENKVSGNFKTGTSIKELISSFTSETGRMPILPEWAYGTWLGVQGGSAKTEKHLDEALAAGNPVTALWIQDWEGRRITKFGSQLKWRWYPDPELYPDFADFVKRIEKKNVKVLGYINSFLADKDATRPDEKFENPMLEEAKAKGYLVKNKDGEDYKIQTAGFPAYLVDLTNPEAYKWLKGIIKKNMIGAGLSGWMADFGEWLPLDCKLHSGISAEIYHNLYPVDWAKLNREAIREAGMEGKIVFFTRAGFTKSAAYSTLFWEGDQMVSFGRHDGLESSIIGLISGGISGLSLNHSDIGGYTTINNPLKNYHRTADLLHRWIEANAFTAVFRTHEGNLPLKNHQVYSSDATVKLFARFGKIHYGLRDYMKQLVEEAAKTGIPPVRAMVLEYQDDPNTYAIQKQFLLGTDLLVVPVLKENSDRAEVYFPDTDWVNVWSGEQITKKGQTNLKCPVGKPCVYLRKNSKNYESLLKVFREAN